MPKNFTESPAAAMLWNIKQIDARKHLPEEKKPPVVQQVALYLRVFGGYLLSEARKIAPKPICLLTR